MKNRPKIFEILSALERSNKFMTSAEIKAELDDIGICLTDRMIRNYLQDFDRKGFTQTFGKEGRKITERGRDELKNSFIYARTDLISDLVKRLMMDAKFDLDRLKGEVVTCHVLIKESHEEKTLHILEEVCQSSLFSPLVKISHAGEKISGREVPKDMFGLSVVSSGAVDQCIFNNGIFVDFGYSGIAKIEDHTPVRCTEFASGLGVSFDPWKLFIDYKMVGVYDAATRGRGGVLVEYDDIPYTVRSKTIKVLQKMVSVLGGTVVVGGYRDNLLGIPTKRGYFGIIPIAGESIIAALEEKGIKTNYDTFTTKTNFKELEPIAPVRGEVILL
ncbi:MAG: DUF128 domain-containing protein [Candidatus Altiarchaeota archaeon]|nr:DUF128 domain-containing protein [Candidatus Altiarchaeota archaeon]